MLQITNFKEHPEDPTYTVYVFADEQTSDKFKELLERDEIPFEFSERDTDDDRSYFAVKKHHERIVTKLNYEAIGTFRKPLISSKPAQLAIYAVTLAAIITALVGFFSQS